jgi:hypothetical protein
MLLLCVVFALITIGFVVPCVLDIARTPRHDFDLPAKQTWLVVVVVFWAFGAAAWLLAGRRDVRTRQQWNDVPGGQVLGQQRAFRRHPAGRGSDAGFQFADAVLGRRAAAAPVRYVAPDDNPDFLIELERRIREWRDGA